VLRLAGWLVAGALSLGATVARAQPAARQTVTVHLDAPSGTELRGRPTARDHWSVVCTAPCDRPLDPTWLYAVDGSGNVLLGAAPGGGSARIVVTPPPSRTPGRAVIVAGGVTYVTGEGMSVAWIVGLILHATGQPLEPWVMPMGYISTGVAVTGLVLVVAGALYNGATRNAGHIDLTWRPPPPTEAAPVDVGPHAFVPDRPTFTVPLLGGAL
jgi:hypothetical protein